MFETKSLNLVKTPATLDAVFSRAALNSLRVGILSISKSAEFLGLHCQSLSVEIHSRFEFQATHYGNTGCGVFKQGYKLRKVFAEESTYPK